MYRRDSSDCASSQDFKLSRLQSCTGILPHGWPMLLPSGRVGTWLEQKWRRSLLVRLVSLSFETCLSGGPALLHLRAVALASF